MEFNHPQQEILSRFAGIDPKVIQAYLDNARVLIAHLDLKEADPKLVLSLQTGEKEKIRLIVNLRDCLTLVIDYQDNAKSRINFLYPYPDWQEDHPDKVHYRFKSKGEENTPVTLSFQYNDPLISSKDFQEKWLDACSLELGRASKSPYKNHNPELYHVIMDPDTRDKMLKIAMLYSDKLLQLDTLIPQFLKWYESDEHSVNEDYYQASLTLANLRSMDKQSFLDFFTQFAKEGGKLQSGGARTANQFRDSMDRSFDEFRQNILQAFSPDLKIDDWLQWSDSFKFFGRGLATIFLNRVNKHQYAVVNNKSQDALKRIGYDIRSGNLVNTYHDIKAAEEHLIARFPELGNFYIADSLTHFIEGTEEGGQLMKSIEGPDYWIFQGNLEIFDVIGSLKNEELSSWSVRAHKKKIKKGDKVIIWLTGSQSGCYALAEVSSDVRLGSEQEAELKYYRREISDELSERVSLKIEHNLADHPILKSQLESLPEFDGFKGGSQGTNFSATREQYDTILKFSTVKNNRRYWLYAPGKNAEMWETDLKDSSIAIGWDGLGDLTAYPDKDSMLEELLKDRDDETRPTNIAKTCFDFANTIEQGDIVFARKGRTTYIGYGIVTSACLFDDNRPRHKSHRKVDWHSQKVVEDESLMTGMKTLTELKDPEKLKKLLSYYEIDSAGVEVMIAANKPEISLNTIFFGPPGTGKTYYTINRALDICGVEMEDFEREEIKELYKKKVEEGQIVFTTFHQSMSYEDFVEGIKPETVNNQVIYSIKDGLFKQICKEAEQYVGDNKAELSRKKDFSDAIGRLKAELEESETDEIKIQLKRKSFHITGMDDQHIKFRKASGGTGHDLVISILKDIFTGQRSMDSGLGIYYEALKDYLKNLTVNLDSKEVEDKNFVIIIDEINRGNISQIFGELITLLEPDKRSGAAEALEVKLPYSKGPFSVPPNLYLIGTMNTADRSVEALDTALRRRFAFEEMLPDPDLFIEHNIAVPDINLTQMLTIINKRIEKLLDKDHTIGHAYFMGLNVESNEDPAEELRKIFQNKILPLLQEYFYGSPWKIELVIGNQFFETQIDDEAGNIFASSNYDTGDLSDHKVYRLINWMKQKDGAYLYSKESFIEAVKSIYSS